MERGETSAQQASMAMSRQAQLRSSLCRGRGLVLYMGREVGAIGVALGGCDQFTASATDTVNTCPVIHWIPAANSPVKRVGAELSQ